MVFLTGLRSRPGDGHQDAVFPLSQPLIRDLDAISFTTPVTFLVGERGSGKSALLE